MLHQKLTHPDHIVVIGGSDNLHSLGGSVLKNLIDHDFKGELRVVNPKADEVQGVPCYRDVALLPETDLAIISIPAPFILDTVDVLIREKETRGFIVFSAGFSELDTAGAELEHKLVEMIDAVGGSLLGPNNIGLINPRYAGVFTTPVPKLDPNGIDFISGSGATAVFIVEAAMQLGLSFSTIWSVGNAAQLGVADVLEHLDETFDPEKSSRVKLLYLEEIHHPEKLLRHARSLNKKGCRIAAIKTGCSEAGSRAASSHTGALASSDTAVDALFKKAGILRCHGRHDLIQLAGILNYPKLPGPNIAIITHAGGPAVMLTDTLSQNGLNVPKISSPKSQELLQELYPGSSVGNPIDFLATGNAEQLGTIIDYCDEHFDEIDAMVVIFGSPGLFDVTGVYDVIDEKIKTCRKPIYPILPSVENAKQAIDHFIELGHVCFSDEVSFGKALAQSFVPDDLIRSIKDSELKMDVASIRELLKDATEGYLETDKSEALLNAAGIPLASSHYIKHIEDLRNIMSSVEFPVAAKVIGPLHKTEVDGVRLHIGNASTLEDIFEELMAIPGAEAVLIQPMIDGVEVFAGIKKEPGFGHLIVVGMGGILIELMKDAETSLAPIDHDEAMSMIRSLKFYPYLEGYRTQEGIDLKAFADILVRLSNLVDIVPEIEELDLNPIMATSRDLIAVDLRIRLGKQ
jgi:acetyltransferase